MNYKEYGGYLPLELKMGSAYYNFDSTLMKKCNSGLTAIYCAIMALSPKRIFIPHFICDTVTDLVASTGIEYRQYYIDHDFKPEGLNLNETDCLLIVNYFGLCSDNIRNYAEMFSNVIIDNTQAFFAKPIFRDGIFNVYSCRKFVGTADGAYVIGNNLPNIQLENDYSAERSLFLLKQHESGINAAYKDSLDSYNIVKRERKNMSVLTDKILSSVDYTYIKQKRLINYNTLDAILGKFNRINLQCSEENVPYRYPFYSSKDIRDELVHVNIYVPTLWKEKISESYFGKIEYDFSKYIMHLPIDQRYNPEDMKYIANCVLKIIGEDL